jgi:hypothetical protein
MGSGDGRTRRGGPYDARWQRVRRAQLQRQPRCRCGARATEVHHRLPLYQGGTHDPANLESLCVDCHAEETGRQLADRNAAGVMSYRKPPTGRERHGPPNVWLGAAFDDFPVEGPALVHHADGRVRFVP